MKKNGLYFYFPLALLLLLDSFFVYKYGLRIASVFEIYLTIFAFVGLKFASSLWLIYSKKLPERAVLGIFIFLFLLFSCLIFMSINPAETKVDRWDAVVFWWDGVFAGKFPYACFTRFNGFPSPLPFLQILCLPFYLIGELGIVILFSLFIFLFFIHKNLFDNRFTLFSFFLMISSIPVWWEICVRSTLLVNGIIIVLILDFLFKNYQNNVFKIIICGVIAGVSLSTRVVVIIPIIVFVSYQFVCTKNWENLILFGTIFLVTFLVTLLPLILFWSIEDFLKFNPINHHERHIPTFYKMMLIVFSILSGVLSKNVKAIYLSVGVCLYFAASIFVALEVTEKGWEMAINKSIADVSYYILAFPCLIYVLLLQLNKNIHV